ncbi:MAG: hypothetical protein ACRDV9_02195 [Acidimicrobiia bacterium]
MCTGNICRSPMAEVLLAARLKALGEVATVRSAGMLGPGREASPSGVAVMAARGLDTAPHRSRRVDSQMLAAADLVVGLAREHVRHVVVERRDVWSRAFALKEIVRRGERVGPRPAPQPLREWLARLHAGRLTADLLGQSDDDDVADPIGQPLAAYEATAVELDGLTRRLAALLAGARP